MSKLLTIDPNFLAYIPIRSTYGILIYHKNQVHVGKYTIIRLILWDSDIDPMGFRYSNEWYLAGVLSGVLGIITHKYPLYRSI